eukprot:362450-Chlamydomonas_euryale.AAC.6
MFTICVYCGRGRANIGGADKHTARPLLPGHAVQPALGSMPHMAHRNVASHSYATYFTCIQCSTCSAFRLAAAATLPPLSIDYIKDILAIPPAATHMLALTNGNIEVANQLNGFAQGTIFRNGLFNAPFAYVEGEPGPATYAEAFFRVLAQNSMTNPLMLRYVPLYEQFARTDGAAHRLPWFPGTAMPAAIAYHRERGHTYDATAAMPPELVVLRDARPRQIDPARKNMPYVLDRLVLRDSPGTTRTDTQAHQADTLFIVNPDGSNIMRGGISAEAAKLPHLFPTAVGMFMGAFINDAATRLSQAWVLVRAPVCRRGAQAMLSLPWAPNGGTPGTCKSPCVHRGRSYAGQC